MPHVREAWVDIPHAALDVVAGHLPSPVLGVASGAVSALSVVRGIQNLRAGGVEHSLEGIGNLALAASSGMHAYEALAGGEHAHGHHHTHGPGIAGTLEMVHGMAEMAIGGMELKNGDRKALGLAKMAKGGAVVAAALIPGAAPVAHLLHLGAAMTVAVMDPTH